jgi:hypothetical protein
MGESILRCGNCVDKVAANNCLEEISESNMDFLHVAKHVHSQSKKKKECQGMKI